MAVQVIMPSTFNDLFSDMQKSHTHFVFVADEYGGVSGIVTVNDLLKEIVGELEDDNLKPNNSPQLIQINKNSWLVKGNVKLKEIEQKMKIDLSDIDYDKFSGFVFSLTF